MNISTTRGRARGVFNSEFVSELIARHQAGENHTERLWALINFEIWQRRFFDGETTQDDEQLFAPRVATGGTLL
jgi:asparagine synthase (glutamine-hydrolysing)